MNKKELLIYINYKHVIEKCRHNVRQLVNNKIKSQHAFNIEFIRDNISEHLLDEFSIARNGIESAIRCCVLMDMNTKDISYKQLREAWETMCN